MKTSGIHARMCRERDSKILLDQARQYVYEYIDAVDDRSVFPDEVAMRNLDRFDEPLPEHSQSGAGTLDMLNTYGAPATVAQTGGRYFGFVNGGVVPTALAARWMADAWDQNPALYVIFAGCRQTGTGLRRSAIRPRKMMPGCTWTAPSASGAYIHYSDHRDGMMHVPEMSRRARAVDLWATLRYLGRNGVAEMIDGMCVRAAQFAGQLAARRFRILNEVVFNQVLVAGDTPEQTREILAQRPVVRRLLVRRDAMERRTGHSHQCQLLGHHR